MRDGDSEVTRYLLGILAVLLLAVTIAALTYRGNAANARAERDAAVTAQQAAEQERDNLKRVIDIERARADRMTRIAEQYEQDKINAQAKADAVIADLRAGAIRLQDKWAGCPAPRLPGIDPAPSEPDAATADREASASRIIRAGAACDAQVRGLQAIVIGDRQ